MEIILIIVYVEQKDTENFELNILLWPKYFNYFHIPIFTFPLLFSLSHMG